MGHSLNLAHTFDDDGCADTITDKDGWTKDQIAQANFGTTYANLTAAQKDQVNLVYNNIMSYHTDEPQLRLSYCQMGRVSQQGYGDRSWLLTKTPIHVNGYNSGLFCVVFADGSFAYPYCDLQTALNAGGLTNRVLVLERKSYAITQETINNYVEIVTRAGASAVTRGVQDWILPVDFSDSPSPEVRRAVRAAQDEDSAVRAIERQAEERIAKTAAGDEKAAIMKAAQEQARPARERAVQMLHEAEKFATGDERISVQYELAQRYQMEGNFDLAANYFTIVADSTDQIKLRDHALRKANECRKLAGQ